MVRFFQLLLQPIQNFLTQWILVSTQPRAFAQERIRLGDTTNFIRAGNFFISAVGAAFLAEVTTLHLLGIGDLSQPFYWLFILLISVPFILFCFLLIRLVAPLSFKDVLHLSFYPIGAGVFAGAAFTLVTAAVIATLVAAGVIPEVRYDYTQAGNYVAGNFDQLWAIWRRTSNDCLKEESTGYSILTEGFGLAFQDLKPPMPALAFLRPAIGLLYLVIAARVFMAAANRRKWVVFGTILLAALVATGLTYLSMGIYLRYKIQNTAACRPEIMLDRTIDRVVEPMLKNYVRAKADALHNALPDWDITARAERRTLVFTYHLKGPVLDRGQVDDMIASRRKDQLENFCSGDGLKRRLLKKLGATETHIFFSHEGERLTSFSIGPADCPAW